MVVLAAEIEPTMAIEDAVSQCLMMARTLSCSVKFQFNSVTLLVNPDSDPGSLVNQYHVEQNEINQQQRDERRGGVATKIHMDLKFLKRLTSNEIDSIFCDVHDLLFERHGEVITSGNSRTWKPEE